METPALPAKCPGKNFTRACSRTGRQLVTSSQEGLDEPSMPSSPPQRLRARKDWGGIPPKQGGEIRIQLALRQQRGGLIQGREPRVRRSGRRASRKRQAHPAKGGKALGARAGGTATSCEHGRRSPGSARGPRQEPDTRTSSWGGGPEGSPAPRARELVPRGARPLPAIAPPFFRASEPPVRRVGTALAQSAARSSARQSGRRALGGGPTTQQSALAGRASRHSRSAPRPRNAVAAGEGAAPERRR